MVITFVCDVLGEANNGTSIATYNVANAMRTKGHEVRFVVPDKDKEGVPGFTVVTPINFGIINDYVAKNGVCLASGKEMDKVEEAIKGSDIVHFNFCGSLSAATVKLCRKLGIPTTASMHSQAENFTNHVFLQHFGPANYGIYRIINHRLFKRVDAIHYPSQFICDLFRRTVKNNVKPYVISNGIQKDFERTPAERPDYLKGKILIAYTARYSKEKTHKILFRAIKRSKHKKDIVLVLPGAGPLEKKLKKYAERYCINEPVFGFHSHEEMVKLLNSCDLYAHPSLIDIEPISCLEAISVGLTPVLTDSKKSSVSSFAISKKNVFKHNDPWDLARKIDYWIENPEEAKANGEKYLGLAKQFDFNDSMDKMEKMFLEVIESKKK